MARGKTAEIKVDDVVKTLETSEGFETKERKVTVAFCGIDAKGNPVYATPNKDGSYSDEYKDKVQKSETRTIKLPWKFNVAVLGETGMKIIREWLKNKMVLNTQNQIKTILAGPDKALTDIEETIKKLGLPESVAATVRAELLAKLQLQNESAA